MRLPDVNALARELCKTPDVPRAVRPHWAVWPHGSRVVVSGGSGSGKTSVVLALLLSRKLPAVHVVWCTRSPAQPKLRLLASVYESAHAAAVERERALAELEEREPVEIPPFLKVVTEPADIPGPEDVPEFSCVVFDDWLGEREGRDAIERWFARGRHSGSSVLYLTQKWTDAPRTCRLNASHALLFPVESKAERRAIQADIASRFTNKQFDQLMAALAAEGRHCSLLFDTTADTIASYCRCEFDRVVDPAVLGE
jgi:hypothetical protein